MAWTGDTFTALLHLTQLHAVYTDLAATMAQQSGSPPPSGVWSFAAASVIDAPGSHHFGQITVDSGIAGLASPESFTQINVASGIAAPQVSSFGQINVGSLSVSGLGRAAQLMQRIHRFDVTCRGGSTVNVYSTYTVASITPVSSLSQLLVRTGLYYSLLSPAAGQEVALGSHAMRNPNGAVGSFAYLTSSAAPVANTTQPIGGAVAGGIGVGVSGNIGGVMVFEAVDSVTMLDPRQYGVAWTISTSTTNITGGFVTIEEWL